MRSFVVMAMFAASFAHAGSGDFEEVRELSLDADGIERLRIKAGAGSMDVKGVEGLSDIEVTAKIIVPNADEEDAQSVIAKEMRLSLERKDSQGRLDAWFDRGFMGFGSDSYIALEVRVPTGLAVDINDGSGSIDVTNTGGDLTIDDGSGSIDVVNAANVKIDDGSGSIDVDTANGDVSIVDGSGSITVKHVNGSVTIDDGSGSIKVSDVEKDLVIIDDGSGGFDYDNVRGNVDADT